MRREFYFATKAEILAFIAGIECANYSSIAILGTGYKADRERNPWYAAVEDEVTNNA